MGQIALGEQAAPATPTAGVVHYATIATPSIAKVKDDAGGDYSLVLLEKAQSFTTTQIIAPATNVPGLEINMPSGATAFAQRWFRNGTLAIWADVSINQIGFNDADFGAAAGPSFYIGRNTNASTNAAGNLRMVTRGGTLYYIWVDNAGNARIGTTQPTNANDLSGTVIGSQSSMAEAKLISDDLSELDDVMSRIRQGAAAVRRFTYRSGAFNGQEFEGLVTNLAPEYGMDRDADHPHGKSLNIITVVGDLLRTVDWLVNRVQELEAKLA